VDAGIPKKEVMVGIDLRGNLRGKNDQGVVKGLLTEMTDHCLVEAVRPFNQSRVRQEGGEGGGSIGYKVVNYHVMCKEDLGGKTVVYLLVGLADACLNDGFASS